MPSLPDDVPHALDLALRERRFIVTAELTSPVAPNVASIRRRARLLRGHVVAANVPDGQAVSAHVSSLAAARLLLDEGLEPVLTLQCRDRNRLALLSDLLGAAALGVRNVFCITGDAPPAGDPNHVQTVFELDSLGLLAMVDGLDNGEPLGGRPVVPPFVPGAAAHPFEDDPNRRIELLVEKVRLGARFAQTQYVFDVPAFTAWMKEVRAHGVDERTAILPSVGPLRSPRVLGFLQRLPGVRIPATVVTRLDGLSQSGFAEESLRIAVETMRSVADIPGVAGVHILAPYWEEQIPSLLFMAGLVGRTKRA